MPSKAQDKDYIEHVWKSFLTTGDYAREVRERRFFRLLPGKKRCKFCFAPFDGLGGHVARIFFNKHPWNMNPRLCNT
jgi:hypothetical protein